MFQESVLLLLFNFYFLSHNIESVMLTSLITIFKYELFTKHLCSEFLRITIEVPKILSQKNVCVLNACENMTLSF